MIKINNYSTKNINILTAIISFFLVIFLNLIFNSSKINSIENPILNFDKEISENKAQDKNNKQNNEELNWYIEIPSIKLKAPINESTKMDILNDYVGHFEDTAKEEGNIGLAGHNRGYKNNYFQNFYKLKKGDEVNYKYNNFKKIYIIEKIETIKSTDWSYLENTKDNKITLITCIENKPDYRLCVQAIEK